ncbi:MAG: PSD1 and planctomycete cytochrome C domain-containing protein [Terriglobia bacterium]
MFKVSKTVSRHPYRKWILLYGYFLFWAVPRLMAAPQRQVDLFEKKIRPIFASRCVPCHTSEQKMAGLDLMSAAGFHKGADTGALLDLDNLDNSRLLKAISYQEPIKMPPGGRLGDQEISEIREWLRLGAPWPEESNTANKSDQPGKRSYPRAGKDFWSFQPIRKVTPPEVKDRAWVRNDIDRFILSKLEEKGLKPSRPADKLTLIRRATLDLTGLTPTETEIHDFLNDQSSDAFAKLVERLLASPRYGERWGRHWLDIARYADSTGTDEDYRYPYAWRYRDYVIESFNRDIPYDRFIREQVAGDLLPAEDGSPVNMNGIIATGFLALGPKLLAEVDKAKSFYDVVDEQIDVTGKAFLGMTLACARCHDHKFDPISTRDYYSLASIFASTKQFAKLEGTVSKLYFAPLVPKEEADRYDGHQRKIDQKQGEIDRLIEFEGRQYRNRMAPQIAAYMLAARKVYAENIPLEQVVLDAALDREMLTRWIEYLKPNSERRVHLEPWYGADTASLATIAKEYQNAFIATAAERDRAMAEWEKKAEEAESRGEDTPERPKFVQEDRFYTEVSTNAKKDSPRPNGPFALPEKNSETLLSEAGRGKWTLLKTQLEQLKKSLPPEPAFACGVAEGTIIDQPVFIRGNHEAKAEIVPKRLPLVLAGDQQLPITHGSGRLELANWLTQPGNPLPARVMVNRIWQWHFREGIVHTPSNFGMTGEEPTHPELLDYLASQFVACGWSVKAMHRLIMLSSTYQMSSEASPESRRKDPDNLLLSSFRIRRLDIEEIRDSLLWIDGSLDLGMGGTLQKGVGTDVEFSDDRKSFNPEESKRRLVYLPLRRSNLATVLNLFDFGDATTSNEARLPTNVAPQALYMMNSKFVSERMDALANKLLADDSEVRRRIEHAWILLLARRPSTAELEEARQYVAGFPGKSDNSEERRMSWSSLCHSLAASNDFIYVY